MKSLPTYRHACLLVFLNVILPLVGCGGGADRILIDNAPGSIVALESFSLRGATGRYPGSLPRMKASHPRILSPETLAQVLSGIQIGLLPPDQPTGTVGVKPVALFSESEVARLAPAIADALKQADADHYVVFETGTAREGKKGSLYIDGPVLQFILSRYQTQTAAHRPDDSLAIHTLSFSPGTAQVAVANPPNWMESEPYKLRLAVAYGKLPARGILEQDLSEPPGHLGDASGPAGTHQSRIRSIEATIEQQTRDLESLKSELESLKTQHRERPTTEQPVLNSTPAAPNPSR